MVFPSPLALGLPYSTFVAACFVSDVGHLICVELLWTDCFFELLRHMPSTLLLTVIMRDLQSRSLEATLHIEAFIRLRTIQYSLVAAHVLRNIIQRLYDA